jgi:hypothetical protein
VISRGRRRALLLPFALMGATARSDVAYPDVAAGAPLAFRRDEAAHPS